MLTVISRHLEKYKNAGCVFKQNKQRQTRRRSFGQVSNFIECSYPGSVDVQSAELCKATNSGACILSGPNSHDDYSRRISFTQECLTIAVLKSTCERLFG